VISFEPAQSPAVRSGELDLAGRRIAVRAHPYAGRAGPPGFGFDPVERMLFRRRQDSSVAVGPPRAETWRQAFARLPAGPVLVGPGDAAGETVWGAGAAAVEGARVSGRAVYLLDPPPDLAPEPGADLVTVFAWAPAEPVPSSAIAAAAKAGLTTGYVFPLLPGWTSDRPAVAALVKTAREAGASFASALLPERDGAARRAIVEARADTAPDAAEQIFGRVHHGDWDVELQDAVAWAAEACASAGIATLPPRPAGRSEPRGNAAASARLEELALARAADEHQAAMARAAVRWIDDSGRDLAAIAREGNWKRVFPFGAELAAEAERALLAR
jgi:hypothetical protein